MLAEISLQTTSRPEGHGWFLSYHCFTKDVKVAFLRGALLRPLPPAASKHKDVRTLDIHEDEDSTKLSSPIG